MHPLLNRAAVNVRHDTSAAGVHKRLAEHPSKPWAGLGNVPPTRTRMMKSGPIRASLAPIASTACSITGAGNSSTLQTATVMRCPANAAVAETSIEIVKLHFIFAGPNNTRPANYLWARADIWNAAPFRIASPSRAVNFIRPIPAC